jgi:hypothetical protein
MFGIEKVSKQMDGLTLSVDEALSGIARHLVKEKDVAAERFAKLETSIAAIGVMFQEMQVEKAEDATEVFTNKTTKLLNYKNYTPPGKEKKTTEASVAKKGEY